MCQSIVKILILVLFFACSNNLHANPQKGLELLSSFPNEWTIVEEFGHLTPKQYEKDFKHVKEDPKLCPPSQ